jgi:hypothetical protein
MKKQYEESNIAAIAEAIRAKNGTTDKYTTAQMAGAISAISSGSDIGDLAKLIEVYDAENTLTSFIVPEGITKLRHYCFSYWDALESVTLPSTLVEIGASCFEYCSSLTAIELPEGLTGISLRAFEESGLESIVIPAGVGSIGEYTFGWCYALTNVTFKGTPTSIDEETFKSCTQAMTINVPWAEGAVAGAPWGATNATINYNYKG